MITIITCVSLCSREINISKSSFLFEFLIMFHGCFVSDYTLRNWYANLLAINSYTIPALKECIIKLCLPNLTQLRRKNRTINAVSGIGETIQLLYKNQLVINCSDNDNDNVAKCNDRRVCSIICCHMTCVTSPNEVVKKWVH